MSAHQPGGSIRHRKITYLKIGDVGVALQVRMNLLAFSVRDPDVLGRLQDYFEQIATDRVTAFDATEFLALARHLDSPMIAALRSVVAGEPPPIVTSTR